MLKRNAEFSFGSTKRYIYCLSRDVKYNLLHLTQIHERFSEIDGALSLGRDRQVRDRQIRFLKKKKRLAIHLVTLLDSVGEGGGKRLFDRI